VQIHCRRLSPIFEKNASLQTRATIGGELFFHGRGARTIKHRDAGLILSKDLLVSKTFDAYFLGIAKRGRGEVTERRAWVCFGRRIDGA
jgi:hypothetical protein